MIFGAISSANLKATELTDIVGSSSYRDNFYLNSTYGGTITNSGTFTFLCGGNNCSFNLNTGAAIDTFINYGTITAQNGYPRSFYWNNGGYIRHIINYGTMGGIGGSRGGASATIPITVTNYGRMRGVDTGWGSADITIDNRGVIDVTWVGATTNHLGGGNYYFNIKNWAMIVNETQTAFNTAGGYPTDGNNSHLVIGTAGRIRFADSSAKIILDFGDNFEMGKAYSLDKLVIENNTGGTNRLKVDFDRLTTRSELYKLTKSGNNFIVNLVSAKEAGYSTIGTLYKSNIRTMNNFALISNEMIYPHKYKGTNRSARKRVIRRVKKTAGLFDNSLDSFESNESFEYSPSLAEGDKGGGFNTQNNSNAQFSNNKSTHPLAPSAREGESILLLKQNETFAYKSDSLLLADSQQDQRAKRLQNSTQSLNTRSVNQTNNNSNSIDSTNRTNQANNSNNPNRSRITNPNRTFSNNNYYFTLTPFINHNYFFESGRYNLSGLEYGFVTTFSGKLNNANSLGTHFVFSYASLNDKDDTAFNIKSMNLNLGLNYKLDLIYSMYLKVRIDGYYFLNEVKSISIKDSIKPNTFGFGASIYYGKEWNFNNYGLLGLSGGLDYKGLYANDFIMSNMADSSIYEKYNKQLYNLLYLDLALDYNKYFSSKVGLWGLNTKLGIKGNITNNALSKSKVFLSNNRSVDMIVDNDKVLGYANISGSYVLNTKSFDMEFSLAYYGSYGDRVMSNGGGVEWRVWW